MRQANETIEERLERQRKILEEREADREFRCRNERRMSDATRRILEVSTELHLTWEEFENVLERVKGSAYICIAPAETKDTP